MDKSSGAISVVRSATNPLDRDIQSEYELLVKAVDGGQPPLSSNTTVHIKLSDANNRSPQFDRRRYSVSVKESIEVDSVVGMVSATDADIGVNAVIEFSITEGKMKASTSNATLCHTRISLFFAAMQIRLSKVLLAMQLIV